MEGNSEASNNNAEDSRSENTHQQHTNSTNNGSTRGHPANSSDNASNANNTRRRTSNEGYSIVYTKLDNRSNETIVLLREILPEDSSGEGAQRAISEIHQQASDMSRTNSHTHGDYRHDFTFGASRPNNPCLLHSRSLPDPIVIPPDFIADSTSGAHQPGSNLRPPHSRSLSADIPIPADYTPACTSGAHQPDTHPGPVHSRSLLANCLLPSDCIRARSVHQPSNPNHEHSPSIQSNSINENTHHQHTNSTNNGSSSGHLANSSNNESTSGHPGNISNNASHANNTHRRTSNVRYTISYTKLDYISHETIVLRRELSPEDLSDEGAQRVISDIYQEGSEMSRTNSHTHRDYRHDITSGASRPNNNRPLLSRSLPVPIVIPPDFFVTNTSGAHRPAANLSPQHSRSLSASIPISAEYIPAHSVHQPSNPSHEISPHIQYISPLQSTVPVQLSSSASQTPSSSASPLTSSSQPVTFRDSPTYHGPSSSDPSYRLVFSSSGKTPRPQSYFKSKLKKVIKYIPPTIPCEFCLRDIFLDASAMCLPCGHLFCEECVLSLKKVFPVCSACLKEFDPSLVIKMYLS